jgi:hypothetical protein
VTTSQPDVGRGSLGEGDAALDTGHPDDAPPDDVARRQAGPADPSADPSAEPDQGVGTSGVVVPDGPLDQE